MRRLAAHLLVLAVTALLVVAGLFTPVPAPVAVANETGGGGGPVVARAEPLPPDWLAAPRADPGAQGLSTPSRVTPPAWVRTVHSTPFWSGPDEHAIQFNELPADSQLQPLGPYLGGRLLVQYAGDGRERVAGPGWVDVATVEPSTLVVATASPTAEAATAFRALPAVAPPTRANGTSPPPVTARYVAIVDEDSGQMIYGNSPHARVAPASTTKIATTIVALEMPGVDLARQIDVTISGWRMAAADGSSILGIEPGETVSLETLLYGMMLPSGNDAAEQTALALGGTRERYVQMMNDKAAAIGLKDTQFVTPSGMDAPGHYSSAYDMAMLARYAMRNPSFRDMAAAAIHYGDGYSMRNANRLIGYYDGADGVKIGYTDEAGKTIVASAVHNGRRVYVSLMRSDDLPTDSIRLFEWVWESFTWP